MGAVEDAVDAALPVLRERPSALVTDVDGTLSRIVARPREASVEETARVSLRRLAVLLDLVAVITGREESVARGMVGVDELTYVGSYAMDSKRGLSFAAVAPALALVEHDLRTMPCVEIERKEISFALHFRNCVDAERVGAELSDLLQPIALETGTKLLEGKLVIEVAPATLPDKGTALTGLLLEHEIRGAVFVGDDLADAEAFSQLRNRRTRGQTPGLCIAVVDAETPQGVRDAADLEVYGVDDVERFLAILAERLAALR
jgi:trehalose 6-phosphate phosphatase